MDTTPTGRAARVGRVKATIVALALGGSLATTGTFAAQSALANPTGSTGTSGITVSDDTPAGTSGTSRGVGPGTGGSSHTTTTGS